MSHDEVYKGNNEGGLYTPTWDAKTLKQMGQDQSSDVEEGRKEAAPTIGPHPRKDEPTPGKVSEATIAMFKRIYARAVEMGSQTTPGQMAIVMRANDHDIGIEACRTLIEAKIELADIKARADTTRREAKST